MPTGVNHRAPDQAQPSARFAASQSLWPSAITIFDHSENLAQISLLTIGLWPKMDRALIDCWQSKREGMVLTADENYSQYD